MAPWVKVNASEEDLQIFNRLNLEYSPLEQIVEVNTNDLEQIAEVNTNGWIVVPQEFSGLKYTFSVSPARIDYNSTVEKVGKSLDLNLENTSKDSLGREFIGNINRNNLLKLNLLMGNETMSPREGIDFIHLLNEGAKGKRIVYNNAGQPLESKYLGKIRDDIIKVQVPLRAEWFDADYQKNEKGIYLNSKHILRGDKLVPTYSKLLTNDTLMKVSKISIDSFFKTRTAQGHVSTKTKEGSFNYWHIQDDNNSGAWLYAGDDGAVLSCDWSSSDVDPSLGGRASKRKNEFNCPADCN